MIARPRPGQPVQVWYNPRVAPSMPHHGRVGVAAMRGAGPGPRNVGVELDGRLVVVPCGNLRVPVPVPTHADT